MHLTLVLFHVIIPGIVAQRLPDITYETYARTPDPSYYIGEAVASEFDRHVPALSDNLRNELSGIRNDINRQFESLKHYMDNKLDRMERDAPIEPPPGRSLSGGGASSSGASAPSTPEAMIRHNLAMAELRRLGADLTKAMNEEVSKLRDEFRTSLDLLREQVDNSTQGMTSRLQGEFTVRAEESVNMLKKVFFLTRTQMALIQSHLNNISNSLNIPELRSITDVGTSNNIPLTTTTDVVTTTEQITTTQVPTTTVKVEDLPKDCYEAKSKGKKKSGVTLIKPSNDAEPKNVWCDQETDGGGWTVLLRRQPQEVQLDFRQDWGTYVAGFGDSEKEHWVGLEIMHQLTKKEAYNLRVDMRWDDEEATSLYDYFSVGPQRYGSRGYELQVGGYNDSSTGGDAMEYHNGMDFSTYDEDNDGASGGSCAEWSGGGGWWYNYCYFSNPTGIYVPSDLPPNTKADHFLEWRKWQGYYTYLSHLVMMIRPPTA